MSTHRWSRWPGAWCLDCGAEDQEEICRNICDWPTRFLQASGERKTIPPCEVHVNKPCPEPGSKKHDPYVNEPSTR